MIISASRRTDIPAHYSDWLLRRLREGVVLTPNPRNPKQVGRVDLSPENVDCIVFWTKNPAPLLPRLREIDAMGYPYYFTFTLTGYGEDIEAHLPPKERLIETFQRLSDKIGPLRVDWRYDPVLVREGYSEQWHLETFQRMCEALHPYTQRCIVNFIRPYRHIDSSFGYLPVETVLRLTRRFAAIAASFGLPLYNCTETISLSDLGIRRAACIDSGKIEEILGCAIKTRKDPGQPSVCRCAQSVDIGMYDTCRNGCVYCYANTGQIRLDARSSEHNPASPLLTGRLAEGAIIRDRTKPSLKDGQLRFL